MSTEDSLEDDVLVTSEEDGPDDQSLADIYKSVTINEDIILVIDAVAEEFLKKGLSAIKYKANRAAKEAGIEFDNRGLEFRVLPWSEAEKKTEEDWEKKIKIQVWLRQKQSIRVHRMIITDKEF